MKPNTHRLPCYPFASYPAYPLRRSSIVPGISYPVITFFFFSYFGHDRQLWLVVLLTVQDPENGQEEIDDVQIKRDRCRNLLFDVIVAHDKLSIHQYISTENKGTSRPVYHLYCLASGEERCHKAKEDHYP